MKKRLLSVLLVMVMMVSVSMPAMAAGTKDGVSSTSTTIHATYKTLYKMNVYKKASTSSKVIYHLSKGKRVIVSEQRGNLVKIKYGKVTGWMKLKNKDGYMLKRVVDGWIKCDGNWYYIYNNGKNRFKSNVMYKANKNLYKTKVKDSVVMVCHKNARVTMTFYKKNGRWIPHMIKKCNIGMEDWETPAGIFTIFKKLKSFEKNGFTYPYAMKFWKGCFAHSTACYLGSTKDTVIKGELAGNKSTHGCISMDNKQAKWFYKKAKVNKTQIIVVNTKFSKWKNW